LLKFRTVIMTPPDMRRSLSQQDLLARLRAGIHAVENLNGHLKAAAGEHDWLTKEVSEISFTIANMERKILRWGARASTGIGSSRWHSKQLVAPLRVPFVCRELPPSLIKAGKEGQELAEREEHFVHELTGYIEMIDGEVTCMKAHLRFLNQAITDLRLEKVQLRAQALVLRRLLRAIATGSEGPSFFSYTLRYQSLEGSDCPVSSLASSII